MAITVAVIVVSAAVLAAPKPEAAPVTTPVDIRAVREDSHRLTSPETEKAVLVEFLDFECGPCRTTEPFMEELRKEYGDMVTFVHRYFPLPGHRNSGTAALAVEAAAKQGKYEQMYLKLFEAQPQWASRNDSQAAAFRGYAQDLGLDMTQYDAATADKSTRERILKDIHDGNALKVTGTPTFLLNGKKLDLKTEAQFREVLDTAVK